MIRMLLMINYYSLKPGLKQQWDWMSKASTEDDDCMLFLCELHFDINCFVLDNEGEKQLKPKSLVVCNWR